MREYVFEELGYFLETECNAIKDALQGKSYMKFDISWSNVCGNCTLIVSTDYEDEPQNIKNFFLNLALSEIYRQKTNRSDAQ